MLIDKEVEVILRDSHCMQIKYLGNQIHVDFKSKIQDWPDFIETTERRNILVHSGGKVTRNYLNNCKEHGVKITKGLREGKFLDISEEYFSKSVKTYFKISFLFGQYISRNLFSNRIEEIDNKIIVDAVELMKEKRWDEANFIFSYLNDLPEKLTTDKNTRKIYFINQCICMYFTGKKKKCRKLLASVDWSDSSERFILAVHVLKDEFDEAEKIMSLMKGAYHVTENDYLTWPLFEEFRKTVQFARAYKTMYGKEYSLLESGLELKKKIEEDITGKVDIG